MKIRRGLVLRIVFAVLFSVLLLELGLRVLTRNVEGHATLFGLKLLPFERLTAAHEATLLRAPNVSDYIIADAHLGWTIKASGRSVDGLFCADALGLRCADAASAATNVVQPSATAAAVLLAGDSFTHGDELPWVSTWSAQLQQLLGTEHRVHNAGVSGYGTDQALLRAEMLLPKLHPKYAVLALCRDDLLRNVNIVRAFYLHWTDFPWTKPRFALRSNALEVLNQPTVPVPEVAATVRAFAQSSFAEIDLCFRPGFYADPWSDASRFSRYMRSRREHRERHEELQRLCGSGGEAVQITAAILERFVSNMRAAGVQPLVLLLPQADDLPRYASGTPSVFEPLMHLLRNKNLPFEDLGPPLLAALQQGEDTAALFVNGTGHPNERAAAVIAKAVAAFVQAPR